METSPVLRTAWFDFVRRFEIVERSVPLFDADADGYVRFWRSGRSDSWAPKRSPQMDELVRHQVELLKDGWEGRAPYRDGLLYLMFTMRDAAVVPLYVGKTETVGREGGWSANLKVSGSSGTFCRWGYGKPYHLGGLGAALRGGDHTQTGSAKERSDRYHRWATTIFEDITFERPRLRQPVRFWAHAWQPDSDTGPWREAGPLPVAPTENFLIGVASALFPETLLNTDGVGRVRSSAANIDSPPATTARTSRSRAGYADTA